MSALHATPQQIGAALETSLDWLHARYMADGQALMWRSGVRAIKAGGVWTPLPSRPDFEGVLMPSGRHVVFDSKHCLDRTYRHDVRTRGHQLTALWAAHEAGALAGILVCNLEAGAGWWLKPWPMWGIGNFHAVELKESACCVAVPSHVDFEGGYMPDWLKVIER